MKNNRDNELHNMGNNDNNDHKWIYQDLLFGLITIFLPSPTVILFPIYLSQTFSSHNIYDFIFFQNDYLLSFELKYYSISNEKNKNSIYCGWTKIITKIVFPLLLGNVGKRHWVARLWTWWEKMLMYELENELKLKINSTFTNFIFRNFRTNASGKSY